MLNALKKSFAAVAAVAEKGGSVEKGGGVDGVEKGGGVDGVEKGGGVDGVHDGVEKNKGDDGVAEKNKGDDGVVAEKNKGDDGVVAEKNKGDDGVVAEKDSDHVDGKFGGCFLDTMLADDEDKEENALVDRLKARNKRVQIAPTVTTVNEHDSDADDANVDPAAKPNAVATVEVPAAKPKQHTKPKQCTSCGGADHLRVTNKKCPNHGKPKEQWKKWDELTATPPKQPKSRVTKGGSTPVPLGTSTLIFEGDNLYDEEDASVPSAPPKRVGSTLGEDTPVPSGGTTSPPYASPVGLPGSTPVPLAGTPSGKEDTPVPSGGTTSPPYASPVGLPGSTPVPSASTPSGKEDTPVPSGGTTSPPNTTPTVPPGGTTSPAVAKDPATAVPGEIFVSSNSDDSGSIFTTEIDEMKEVPHPDDAYDDSSLGSLDTADNTEYTQEYIDALSEEEDKQLLLKFNRQIRKKRAKDALFFYGDEKSEKDAPDNTTNTADAADATTDNEKPSEATATKPFIVGETSEDEMADESCFVCGKDDSHELFFCYECDAPYHSFCLKLKSVPEGEWYCDECNADAGPEPLVEPPPGAESKEAEEELDKIMSGKYAGAGGFKNLIPEDYAFIGALRRSIKEDEYFLPRGVTSIVTPEGYIDERIIEDVYKRSFAALGVDRRIIEDMRKRSAAALGVGATTGISDPAATTATQLDQPPAGEHGSLVLPSYIEQQGKGEKKNLYVNLEMMDTETRVRCEVLMSAYSNYTHYQKITNPFICLADMMGVDKVEIAVAVKKEDIAAWDWNSGFPKVPDANGLQTKLLKALFVAIRTGKSREELVRQKQLPELKGWRPFIRLWRQGRQLYSDMQHMFPDLSKQELEVKIVKAFGDCNTKSDVDETVASFARMFRKEKLATERAKSFVEKSATGEQVTEEDTMKAAALRAAAAAASSSCCRIGQKASTHQEATTKCQSSPSSQLQ